MDPANEEVDSLFDAYTQTCDETNTAPPLVATLDATVIPAHTPVSPLIHPASTLDRSNVGFSAPPVEESGICSSMDIDSSMPEFTSHRPQSPDILHSSPDLFTSENIPQYDIQSDPTHIVPSREVIQAQWIANNTFLAPLHV